LGKKKVRFADTAGKGPLYSVMGETKLKTKKKPARPKKQKKAEQARNSCACTIF
jgi:hypothetical protein